MLNLWIIFFIVPHRAQPPPPTTVDFSVRVGAFFLPLENEMCVFLIFGDSTCVMLSINLELLRGERKEKKNQEYRTRLLVAGKGLNDQHKTLFDYHNKSGGAVSWEAEREKTIGFFFELFRPRGSAKQTLDDNWNHITRREKGSNNRNFCVVRSRKVNRIAVIFDVMLFFCWSSKSNIDTQSVHISVSLIIDTMTRRSGEIYTTYPNDPRKKHEIWFSW